MTNVQDQELEVIVDDKLVNAIEIHQAAHAETQRAMAKVAVAKKDSEQAQGEVDALVAAEAAAWGAWQTRLKKHEGTSVILNGVVFVPQGSDDDSFQAKHLRPSGSPRVSIRPDKGHTNGTAVNPRCQSKRKLTPAGTLPSTEECREAWLAIIRRAIADRIKMKELQKTIFSLDTSTRGQYRSEVWASTLDTLHGDANLAQDWLCACILTYFGRIPSPDQVDELADDWKSVAIIVDDVMYVVRGHGDDPDDGPGKNPTLEITSATSFELAWAAKD